ncbi:MAG: hypothetical protein JKY94_17560 [Rhodobacteraceae bacterium]|nr:hypothetical protein [Paracoccaceae bacterium]
MTQPVLRTFNGLDISGSMGLFLKPHWADPVDAVDMHPRLIEGLGTSTKADTLVGPTVSRSDGSRWRSGGTRWSCKFVFRRFTHKAQYEFFDKMRRWLGVVNPFWMPSWNSDFSLVKDADPADGNVLYTRPNGFSFVYEEGRYGVLIETLDGFMDVHLCSGYDESSGCLFLSDALQTKVALSNVARVSLVRHVRSATKEFDWKFTTDAVVEIPLSVREVLGEGTYL